MKLEMTQEQELITGMVRKFVREEIVPLELNLDPDADELDPQIVTAWLRRQRQWASTDLVFQLNTADQTLI